jgi:hypothetical protein
MLTNLSYVALKLHKLLVLIVGISLVFASILLDDFFIKIIFNLLNYLFGININIQENLELALMSAPLLTPVFVYHDLVAEKASIYSDNKDKSGIYLWRNKINGKIYVGSSVNLSKRFKNYFNESYTTRLKDFMIIYKALLSYGFENFSLEILEHCDPSFLLEREQYYLDLLKPDYNILKIAGSSLGYKHTKEVLLKMKNCIASIEARKKMSEKTIKGNR